MIETISGFLDGEPIKNESSGRTAYEDEMREALATELALVVYEGGMVTPRAFADRLLAGPLARLQADLTAAREERDEWQQVAEVEATERRRLQEQHRIADIMGEVGFDRMMQAGEARDAAESEASQLRERVGKLEEVLRPFAACVFNDNGDVTISTGNLTVKDWLALERVERCALPLDPSPQGEGGEA